MSCCSKTIKKIVKAEHIVRGNIFALTGVKFEVTDDRIRTCWSCIEQTWLTWPEYYKWLFDNGVKVLANLEQLEVLPKLPKYEQDEKKRNLFCRICKCFIPAKARIKGEKCLMGKWEVIKK
jgi:hypothetical protein